MKLAEILARELEEWPKNDCVVITQDGDGVAYLWRHTDLFFTGHDRWVSADGKGLCDGKWDIGVLPELATDHTTAIITREMWEAELAKMVATDRVKSNTGRWYKHINGVCHYRDGNEGEWVPLGMSKAETIEKEWRGPQDGLPPVGMVCQVEAITGTWYECLIVGHHCDKAVFYCEDWTDNSDYDAYPTAMFRPINTPDREKWIDAAEKAIRSLSHSVRRMQLAAIYDAGLAKLPEE